MNIRIRPYVIADVSFMNKRRRRSWWWLILRIF